MNRYRDCLYENYSANFGEKKNYAPETQFAIYERLYQKLPDNRQANIADLGCGKGEWLTWMQRRGFENLTGIDVAASELAVADGGNEIDFKTGDITESLKKSPATFDLLHAKDVLEHLAKDEAVEFLHACHAALKPGGELWILTFNAQSPLANATRYGDFTHELGVTPTSLAQVIRATGFPSVEVRGFLPTSASLKGKIRATLFSIFEIAASCYLKLRHGNNSADSGVEANSVKPDIFAVAKKLS